jgi:cytochrome c-type biogenesis protein CcmF
MQELGQLLLVITFLASLATACAAAFGAIAKRPLWMHGARHGLIGVGLLTVAMAVILTHGFLTHDYSSRYIYEYSDRAMPLIYKLAAFWGGERGALLFWVTSLAVFSNVAIYTRKDRSPEYLAWVICILALAVLFFLVLMVFQTSPFDTWMAQPTPEDGRGLNPLLQNPVMAFHPPALLTGYILFTIPFAFGMSALITNKLDDQWIGDTRRWTIVSWTFLSVGLLLGCRWAYMEIGWGFWWMWDAVENAGLVPWFTATAFLHSVMIQERRGMLKRWNVILLALTFLLTIVGTWMTRSQIIVSVHAFADSELSDYFLVYMAIIAAVATGLIGYRWKALRSEARIESFMSREAMFVLNNVILVFCAVITLYGTLMGKFTESTTVQSLFDLEQPIVWDEEKFNEVFVPIGLALLLIMGIGPLISWRKATASNFRKNFLWPLAWGSLSTFIGALIVLYFQATDNARIHSVSFGEGYTIWVNGIDFGDWMSVVVYWMSAFVIFSIIREFHIAAQVRKAQQLGSYLGNWVVVLFKNPRRYGGYIVHIGVVFMFFAFTGKAFKHEEKDRLMAIGDTHVLNRYALTLVDRDHRYSTAEGCVISDATFVAMPLKTSVSEASVNRTEAWLTSVSASPFHLRTNWEEPQIEVRIKDPDKRRAVLLDFYLARHFRKGFERSDDAPGLVERWAPTDRKLVENMPMHAMEKLRQAREQLGAARIGVAVELTPGSPEMRLRFENADAQQRFHARLASANIPDWVLTVIDDSETGALMVVDRGTGQVLVPESRFYPTKQTSTTEVSISGEDFLEDLYVSMQPDMGRPYVKVFTVVFPLVNFLWIGGFLLLLGSLICLTPRWLGRTLASFVAGRPAEAVLILLFAALALTPSPARAEAPPEPFGFAPPSGDPTSDLLIRLDCACPLAAGVTSQPSLGDPSCNCPAAESDRRVVASLLNAEPADSIASGRAKFDVANRLIELDPAWEPRLRDEGQQLATLLRTTRTTCSGEYLMTLEASRATCTQRMQWIQVFRTLIVAGVSNDDIFNHYLAHNNATQPGGKGPWKAHELKTSEEATVSFGLPVALTALVVGAIVFMVLRNGRRARIAAASPNMTNPTTEREGFSGQISDKERARLRDELEAWDS